jgi:Meiotically up-regulated gene 113
LLEAPEYKVGNRPIAEAGRTDGFVYLFKSGRYYKIGKTNSVGQRKWEVALQLPERVRVIHEIKTDDPTGIEVYWHNRFKAKKMNEEWFGLSSEDVSVFRRMKFM